MAKILLIIAFLLPTFLLYAQTYVTKQDVNVRKGAGVKYETLGIIHKEETIEVLETTGIWGEINYEGSDGYISTKFLLNSSEVNVSNPEHTSQNSIGVWKWMLVALVIVLLIIFRNNPIISFIFRLIGSLFKLFINEGNSSNSNRESRSLKREVYCSKCGENKGGSVTRVLECPSGGKHNWRV